MKGFKQLFLYLSLPAANGILLGLLGMAWADPFTYLFTPMIISFETLKIFFFCILSLIGMAVLLFRIEGKEGFNLKKKLKYSAVLILIISSYLYITYAGRIIQNRILNSSIRASIVAKADRPDDWQFGVRALNLTYEEYSEVCRVTGYEELPDYATNISVYYHKAEFLLPDYNFGLSYDVPKDKEAKEIKKEREGFSIGQTFKIEGEVKKVYYVENCW